MCISAVKLSTFSRSLIRLTSTRLGIISHVTRSLSQFGYGQANSTLNRLNCSKENKQNPMPILFSSQRRHLFDEAYLGVTDFKKMRAHVHFQYQNSKSKSELLYILFVLC